MRKSLLRILALPMLLGACDRPEVVVDILPCCDMGEKTGMIKFAVYSDGHAVATIKGDKVPMTIDDESLHDWYTGDNNLNIEWKGVLPNDGSEIRIYAGYDIEKHLLSVSDVGSATNGRYSSYVFRPAHIKELDNSYDAICRSKIRNKLSISTDGKLGIWEQVVVALGTDGGREYYSSVNKIISAEDIKQINKKWDYSTKNWWTLEEDSFAKITDFGDEPCVVWERLKKYISDNGLQNKQRKETICKNPENVYMLCENVTNSGFQYLTLGKCSDGRGVLHIWNNVHHQNDVLMTRDANGENWTGAFGFNTMTVSDSAEAGKYTVTVSNRPGIKFYCQQSDVLYEHQKCARKIAGITRLTSDGAIELDVEHRIKHTEKGDELVQNFVPLTQEQALSASRNFDYSNLKLYKNGDMTYEADACDALGVLDNIGWEIKKSLRDKK